jgi:hypothetical protein
MRMDVEDFWLQLEPLLNGVANAIAQELNYSTVKVERYSNLNFPLRAYIEILMDPQGESVAVVVDVESASENDVVSSEVCFGSGAVIAVGPALLLSHSILKDELDRSLGIWLCEFNSFLLTAKPVIIVSALALQPDSSCP